MDLSGPSGMDRDHLGKTWVKVLNLLPQEELSKQHIKGRRYKERDSTPQVFKSLHIKSLSKLKGKMQSKKNICNEWQMVRW